MKTIIIKAICLIGLSTSLMAQGQFGLTGTLNDGAGVSYVNDTYTASLLYSTINNRAGVDEDESNLEINLKYKRDLDEKTKATFGVRHVIISLKTTDDDDSDENSKTAITTGIEHELSSRVLLFAELDVYAMGMIDDGDEDESSIFDSGKLGLTLLFN